MAGRGKGALRIAIEDFLETFEFGDILFNWQSKVLEKFEDAGVDFYAKLADTIYPDANLPANMSPERIGVLVKSHQVGFFGWLAFIIGLILGGFFGAGQPAGRIASYVMDSQVRSYRPTPGELYPLARRYPEFMSKLDAAFSDLGVPDLVQSAYEKATEQVLSPVELAVLRNREKLSDSEFTNELKIQGWTDERIQMVRDLSRIIPGPQDLISMAVREAFDDRIASQFGYDENFPAEFAEWADKQGLDREWSIRYWRAHWQLPSPNQVFEMLHRLRPGVVDNPITSDIVSDYLRIADYAPYWRDKLQAISYAPFTRVDVRRMYKTHTLDEDGVYQAYLDLGYDEFRAGKLTEFTIAYETEEETGVVRSSVTSAYNSGFIDRARAESMLRAGGYDDVSIGFYLDAIDFNHSLSIQSLKLSNIKKQYVEGFIDETTVNNQINQLNLPAERVTALLELWNTERENKTALPTTSQIEKFYEMGIASVDDFTRIFKLRGYTDETIQWTLERIDLEAQAQATKDAERALKEAERLGKSETTTVYQFNKAALDLEIAKAKQQLTDIAVALHGELDEIQAAELVDQQDYLKQYIAAVQVAKAQLKQDLIGTKLQ